MHDPGNLAATRQHQLVGTAVGVLLCFIGLAACGDSDSSAGETTPDESADAVAPPPTHDPDLSLPSGWILAKTTGDESPELGRIELPSDGAVKPWAGDVWRSARLSPTGDQFYVVAQDGQPALADLGGTRQRTLDRRYPCPAFSLDGAKLVWFEPTPDAEGANSGRLTALDLTDPDAGPTSIGNTIEDDPQCPIPLEDGLGFSAEANGDLVVMVADSTAGNATTAFARSTCSAVTTPASPDGFQLPIVANCDDVTESGLYLYNTRDESLTHVLGGLIGSPSYSLDGEWLAFSHIPSGDANDQAELWIATADGLRARRLVDSRAFPTIVVDP